MAKAQVKARAQEPGTAPGTVQAEPATAQVAAPPATVAPAYRMRPGTIQVNATHPGAAALKGARAAWYAVLVQHNGQPASAYLAACTANPPSLPQRGKNAGKPEPASGWLGWFARHGYCTIS
jgi:hypothetical protein